MNRRDFIKIAAGGVFAAAVTPCGLMAQSRGRMRTDLESARYRIRGNKRLGCSGFDFPDDPDILENGYFMPSL